MDFKSKLESLKRLNLPNSDFIIVSSGALAIRGIREARDIDVVVTKTLWNELSEKYPVVLEDNVERIHFDNDIEILNPKQSIFGNSELLPLEEMFKEADVFEDIKFINLNHLKKVKQKVGREKDLNDIVLIDNYLESQK